MMPVTVERAWDGKRGAMTWWVDDVVMDEQARLDERRWPDDMQTFNQQYYRMLVFAELVYDTDRNQGNILYDSSWRCRKARSSHRSRRRRRSRPYPRRTENPSGLSPQIGHTGC